MFTERKTNGLKLMVLVHVATTGEKTWTDTVKVRLPLQCCRKKDLGTIFFILYQELLKPLSSPLSRPGSSGDYKSALWHRLCGQRRNRVKDKRRSSMENRGP